MRRSWGAIALALAFVLAACGGSSDSPVVKLDGSPRVPDAEGVVQSASAGGIRLDGGRSYGVSKNLIAFSTYDREPIQLARVRGSYVQVGLRKGTVVWLARIGLVTPGASGKAVVQYQGNLVRVRDRRMEFRDGTVLKLAPELKAPERVTGSTFVVIDPKRHVVQGARFAAAATSTTRT
jgi:hypothetical protein